MMHNRPSLVVANWKMNGSRSLLLDMLNHFKTAEEGMHCQLVWCLPYIYLAEAVRQLVDASSAVGAQDLSANPNGAFTGEVSAAMLLEVGCRYVIVGHSERRRYHAETDTLVAEKCVAACKAGLTPIVCIGESQEERDKGETETVLKKQLGAIFSATDISRTIAFAYEPVWAIGGALAASAAQISEAHRFIRLHLANHNATFAKRASILYGGSVSPANIAEIASLEEVDGVLVGGASLSMKNFSHICKTVNQLCTSAT